MALTEAIWSEGKSEHMSRSKSSSRTRGSDKSCDGYTRIEEYFQVKSDELYSLKDAQQLFYLKRPVLPTKTPCIYASDVQGLHEQLGTKILE